MIFFFFVLFYKSSSGGASEQSRRDVFCQGKKGKPLIINSPFCPCFTTCKDSKRINFGRACKIAIPGIHHRMLQWTPSLTVFPAFSHFCFTVSAKELRLFEINQTVRRENAKCLKRFPSNLKFTRKIEMKENIFRLRFNSQ